MATKYKFNAQAQFQILSKTLLYLKLLSPQGLLADSDLPILFAKAERMTSRELNAKALRQKEHSVHFPIKINLVVIHADLLVKPPLQVFGSLFCTLVVQLNLNLRIQFDQVFEMLSLTSDSVF